jgi:hypothetical protein
MSLAKVRGLGYILWQSRHMAYHVMVGLLWAWFLRELWGEFNLRWIVTAVIGSVLPDTEHLYYWFGYGRKDAYVQEILTCAKKREWRKLFYIISTGHKFNTSLSYHNIYVVWVLIGVSIVASCIDWRIGVVLFGAMVSHYVFDMADDLVQLGEINANWRRWGR